MIPRNQITAWRAHAPWIDDTQVEQDLVLSRSVVSIFSTPALAEALAFRGGTALHKLYLAPAARYSEDIDLAQVRPGKIGPIIDDLRSALRWLGEASFSKAAHGSKLTFSVAPETRLAPPMKIKIEINTRDHFALDGYKLIPFVVESPWFTGRADMRSFSLDELLATKLRALYQRDKGRDLFDLWYALRARTDSERIVAHCKQYLREEGHPVSRRELEENLKDKLADEEFFADVEPLLRAGVEYDIHSAAAYGRSLAALF